MSKLLQGRIKIQKNSRLYGAWLIPRGRLAKSASRQSKRRRLIGVEFFNWNHNRSVTVVTFVLYGDNVARFNQTSLLKSHAIPFIGPLYISRFPSVTQINRAVRSPSVQN